MTYHELRRLKTTDKYTNGSIDFEDSRHVNIYLKPFALNTSKDKEDYSPIMKSTQQGFVLDGDRAVKDFLKYNALKDKHLVHHFANKRKRRVLTSNELITRGGHIIERKTCVENYDKIQAANPNDTFYYHQVRGGTLILGSQLPKVREKSNSKANFHDPKFTEYNRQKSLKGVFPTTPQLPQRVHTAKSKSPQPKTPNRTTFYYNIQVQDESATTPITRKNTVEDESPSSPSPKPLKGSKSSKTLHTNLRPVSKDELNSIFSVYKKRLETSKELDRADLSPSRSPELKRPKRAVVNHFRTLSAITNQGTSPSPQIIQMKTRDQTPEATSVSISFSKAKSPQVQQKIETKFGRNLRIKHTKNSKSNDNLYKHSKTVETISNEEPSTIKISQIISNHNQGKWYENKIDLMDSCPPDYFGLEGSQINPIEAGDNLIEKSISISGIQQRDEHITLNSYDELK